jgi:hypothetical protein
MRYTFHDLGKRLAYRFFKKREQRLDDIYSYSLIRNFFPSFSYFPITNSSLNFHSIATIINDILLNNKKTIVEFGAGLSTLVIAGFAKATDKEIIIHSIDHDEDYILLLKEIVAKEGLEKYINFIHAELQEQTLTGISYFWYSQKTISLSLLGKVNIAIIDGPITKNSTELVRYPAISFIKPLLASNHSIYLDDIHRVSEQRVMKKAYTEQNLKFVKVSQTLAACYSSGTYNPIA